MAGTQVAVYKTVDGGRSWRPSKRGLFVPHLDRLKGWVIALAVDPTNTDIVYAGSDRVSKSSDGGHSWKTVFAPHPTQSAPTSPMSSSNARDVDASVSRMDEVPRAYTTADTDIVESRFIDLVSGVRVVQAVDFVSDDPS